MKIKSITKGSDITAKTYTVGTKYSRINEEWKVVQLVEGKSYEILVYRVYDTDGDLAHEIETIGSLSISYDKDKRTNLNKPTNGK